MEETGGNSVIEGKEVWSGSQNQAPPSLSLSALFCIIVVKSLSHPKPLFLHLQEEGLDKTLSFQSTSKL